MKNKPFWPLVWTIEILVIVGMGHIWHHEPTIRQKVNECEAIGTRYTVYYNHLKNHYTQGCLFSHGNGEIFTIDLTTEK